MDWSALSQGFDSVANLGLGVYNAVQQSKQFDYQKSLQKQIFQREDTAVQRRRRDLEAAGFNPNLAAGNGAEAGSVVNTQAPQANFKVNTFDAFMAAQQIAQAREQTKQMKLQTKNLKLESDMKELESHYFVDEYEFWRPSERIRYDDGSEEHTSNYWKMLEMDFDNYKTQRVLNKINEQFKQGELDFQNSNQIIKWLSLILPGLFNVGTSAMNFIPRPRYRR